MSDGPDEDAYSRLTDPDRYRALVAHARRAIDRLVTDFDCRHERPAASDLPERLAPTTGEETIVIRPASPSAAPLVFRIRDRNDVGPDADPHRRYVNHGITVRAGRWHDDGFPRCGCDACDEGVDDLCDLLDELVTNVVTGPFAEEWDGRELSYEFAVGGGRRWGIRFADEFRGVAPTRHDWEPWSRR